MLFLNILLILLLLSSCNNPPSHITSFEQQDVSIEYQPHKLDPEDLDIEIAKRLRTDFLAFLKTTRSEDSDIQKWTISDIWVQQYFGTYNGCEAVYIGSYLEHTDEIREIEIAGYNFRFPSSQLLYIHKDATFIEIKEAYDTGIIVVEMEKCTEQQEKESKWNI